MNCGRESLKDCFGKDSGACEADRALGLPVGPSFTILRSRVETRASGLYPYY